MHSTARVISTRPLRCIMATLGAIAGFVAFAATGDRASALSATLVVFALAGIVAMIRLAWRSTANRLRPNERSMNETLVEIQRLIEEIAAHLGAATKSEDRKAVSKLERISALAATSALTIQVVRR